MDQRVRQLLQITIVLLPPNLLLFNSIRPLRSAAFTYLSSFIAHDSMFQVERGQRLEEISWNPNQERNVVRPTTGQASSVAAEVYPFRSRFDGTP